MPVRFSPHHHQPALSLDEVFNFEYQPCTERARGQWLSKNWKLNPKDYRLRMSKMTFTTFTFSTRQFLLGFSFPPTQERIVYTRRRPASLRLLNSPMTAYRLTGHTCRRQYLMILKHWRIWIPCRSFFWYAVLHCCLDGSSSPPSHCRRHGHWCLTLPSRMLPLKRF